MNRSENPSQSLPQLYRPEQLARVEPPTARFDQDAEAPSWLSLERLWGVLVRRKWLLLAVVATVVTLSALDLYTTTYQYRASARLQIDPENTNVLPYQGFADPNSYYYSLQYQETQLEKIRSYELAERVAKALELEENADFHAPARSGVVTQFKGTLRTLPARLLALASGAARSLRETSENPNASSQVSPARDTLEPDPLVSRLRAGIQARPVGETRLIEVSYTSPVPAFAATAANTVAEEFVKLHLESRYDATSRATEFLRVELDELKIQVERSEEELLGYASEKNIMSLSERETLNRKKLAALTDELTAAEAELIAQAARVGAATGGAPGSTDVILGARTNAVETRLAELRSELSGLSVQYGPEWPAIKDLQRQIDEQEAQLREMQQRSVENVQQSYAVARGRHDRLLEAVAAQKEVVEKLDSDSIQYNILKREVETNQELYEGLLQRLKEAGVAAGLESSNIQVAERAFRPGSPSYPQRMNALTQSLMTGLLLGFLVIFGFEALDKTIKTTEDVQQFTGLPSLGVVPMLGAAMPKGNRSKELRPILARDGDQLLGVNWEAYRSLRTSLLLSHSEPPQAILVTSAGPAEGKTTTAANLAAAFAQTGARTLLVDLDLRRPVLASSFDLPGEKGMSTFLSGNSDLSSQILQTTFKNLFLIPAGPSPPNPPELIGSERFAEGIELLRDFFTYIVIDSPPALALSDSYLLSSHLDGVILVARAGKTPKKALRKAGQGFLKIGTTIFGVVLNDVSMKGSEYGYYYGRGAYGYYSRKRATPSEADAASRRSTA